MGRNAEGTAYLRTINQDGTIIPAHYEHDNDSSDDDDNDDDGRR